MKIVVLNKALFISLAKDDDDNIREASEIYGFRIPFKTSIAKIEQYINYLAGCQIIQSYGKDLREGDDSICEMIGRESRKHMGIRWEVYDTACDLKEDLVEDHFLTNRSIWKDIKKYGKREDVRRWHGKHLRMRL